MSNEKVLSEFKVLVLRTLKDQDVRDEVIKMLEYVLAHKESEDITSEFLEKVFLREDILNSLVDLLKKAAVITLQDKTVKDTFQDFIFVLAKDSTIKKGVYDNYILSPFKSWLSLGYLEKKEKKEDESYSEVMDFISRSKQQKWAQDLQSAFINPTWIPNFSNLQPSQSSQNSKYPGYN